MQELIDKLKNEHGLSHEQAHGILGTITNFIKEKFPMAEGMIDNLFHHQNAETENTTTPTGDAGSTEGPASKGGSFLDQISDYIPGSMGEKAEEFAKDKLGGMFGGDKKSV